MVSIFGERATWLKYMFSTRPADRKRAQAAVSKIYLAAGLAVPQHFLWFDSPHALQTALNSLLAPHDPVLIGSWARGAKTKIPLPGAGIRDQFCAMLAAPNWDAAITAIGKPMGHDVRYHKHLDVKMSKAISDAWRTLYPTRWRAQFDDTDDLHRAERRYWNSSLGVLGHDLPEGHTIVLGWTIYDLYNFSDMAQDASQAGKGTPAVLAAAWEVAQSAGLWWAFENAAILTERPVAPASCECSHPASALT